MVDKFDAFPVLWAGAITSLQRLAKTLWTGPGGFKLLNGFGATTEVDEGLPGVLLGIVTLPVDLILPETKR